MVACTGQDHTIYISDDGTLYSFGDNSQSQLGLINGDEYVTIPTPIPNLPKIGKISCGENCTVCVDEEGFTWSFGVNKYGELGTGDQINKIVPQKIPSTLR